MAMKNMGNGISAMKNMGNGISEALKIKIFWGPFPQTPLAPRTFGARFPCASSAYLDGKPRYASGTQTLPLPTIHFDPT